MISCIATNENNDWYLNAYKSIAFVNNYDATNQAIKNLLQMWVNEWLFNQNVGINYPLILSPKNSNSQQDVLDFNIQKVFKQPYSTTTWYLAQANWNQYLQENFGKDIYDLYHATLLNFESEFTNNKLTININIQYGTQQTNSLLLSIDPIPIQSLPYVYQKSIEAGSLLIELFTPNINPINRGQIIILQKSYVANVSSAIYTNLDVIYPASLIANTVELTLWKELPYQGDLIDEYKILIPNLFKVNIL